VVSERESCRVGRHRNVSHCHARVGTWRSENPFRRTYAHWYTGSSVFTQVLSSSSPPRCPGFSAGVEAFWGMIGGAARRDGYDWLDTTVP
jgi:hypothetical protein